jgi:hypothetical protein
MVGRKKYFELGRLGHPTQDKNQNLVWNDKPNKPTIEGPLSYEQYSLSLHSPQFKQSAGATPL